MSIFRRLFATFSDKYLEQLWADLNRRIQSSFDDATLNVPNLAAFATLDATVLPDGTAKRVLTLRANFVLDKASVLAPDGITIVAATGGGNWIRTAPDQPDAVWQLQGAWFINATTGNDEAVGSTSPTAIKTWAEYERRVGSMAELAADTTVTIETDLPALDLVRVRAITGSYHLRVKGAVQVLLASTVVSFTAAAANQGCLLAITGFDAAGNE